MQATYTREKKHTCSNYGEKIIPSLDAQRRIQLLYFPFLERAHKFWPSSPFFVSYSIAAVFGEWMYLTALILLDLLRLNDTLKYRIRRIHKAITIQL